MAHISIMALNKMHLHRLQRLKPGTTYVVHRDILVHTAARDIEDDKQQDCDSVGGQ